jgi:hypothetical protein
MYLHRARPATPSGFGLLTATLIGAVLIVIAQLFAVAPASAPFVVPAVTAPAEAVPAAGSGAPATIQQDAEQGPSDGPALAEPAGSTTTTATEATTSDGMSGQDAAPVQPATGIAPSRFADIDPTAPTTLQAPAPGGTFKFKPGSNP